MRAALTFLFLWPVTAVAIAAQESPQTYADPAEAMRQSPVFRVQGEYLGTLVDDSGASRPIGVQVVAVADDRVTFVVLPGGLPGAGSDGRDATAYSGDLSGPNIRIAGGPVERVVADGNTLAAYRSSTEVWTARRVSRESPTAGARAPENAVVLFDGSSTNAFEAGEMTEDGLLIAGTRTRDTFRDFTLHLEFRLPFKPTVFPGNQDRGNSGLYIFDRYEVQILDSFGLHYSTTDGWEDQFEKDWQRSPPSNRNQWGGALYLAQPPDIAMNLPPLTWQTYDIEFTAPRFDDTGRKVDDARISVRHNGVLVHDGVRLSSGTGAGGKRPEIPDGPLVLQDHANPVRFRNIWIVPR